MTHTLAVSYLNGLLELTVTDDPDVSSSDYEVLDGVPGLEVSQAETDGRILRRGDITGLLVLRFHEKGSQIVRDLQQLGLPEVYDVPSQGLFSKTLAEVFRALYMALVAAPKAALPWERAVEFAEAALPA